MKQAREEGASMADNVNYEWEPWPDDAKKSDWGSPGVYALVATRKGYPTVLDKKSRVLYIGETGSLYDRLHIRRDKKANHHLLWYLNVAVEDGKSKTASRLNDTLKQVGDMYDWKVFACKFGKGKIRYHDEKGRKETKAATEMLEELLLINHFFEYGQFPPFNTRARSIKSIAEYWTTTKQCEWWESYWNDWKVEKCWKGLLKKK